jgi:hypothetical protein
LFLLRYTAGESLDELRADLTGVIELYEQSTAYARAEHKSDDAAPLMPDELEDYERMMQLIGLCFLLHRTDLLPRIAAMFDGSIEGEDGLYEDLLSYYLDDRYEADGLLHAKPYKHLLKGLRREEPKSMEDIEKYLKAWYPAMKNLTWHDSHLDLTENGPGYFGYWAIEAAAVVFLLNLDDRSIRDILVYPKDLVDYARILAKQLPDAGQPDHSQLRIEGGKSCPQAGYWTTPAQQDSRRFFNSGEVMPTFEHSPYGATIWQWSENQDV